MFRLLSTLALSCAALFPFASSAQSVYVPTSTATPADYLLITVIMRHDQSMNLDQINKVQAEQKFFGRIPPEGVEVVSWHVAMGLGYVVVFKVPPARLRELNRAIEMSAWGAFKTEFYPTYDLTEPLRERHRAEKGR